MQVKLCDFFESERLYSHKMAVFAMIEKILFTRPRLLDHDQVFVEPLPQLVFHLKFILICNRSHDECLVLKLLLVTISDKLSLEVASIVLSLILMHPLVDKCLSLQWLLDIFKVIISLI